MGPEFKLFISQPMKDKTDEQIQVERDRALETAKKALVEKTGISDPCVDKAARGYLGNAIIIEE